jgi:uncharacterized coiled-coil protein SlyX
MTRAQPPLLIDDQGNHQAPMSRQTGPLIASVLLAGTALLAADETATKSFADRYGLTLVGNTWVTPLEQRLRTRLHALEETNSRLKKAQLDLNKAIRTNASGWKKVAQFEEQLRQLIEAKARFSAGSPQHESLERQIARQRDTIKAIAGQCVSPEKFGAKPAVREAVVNLANLRHDLLLSVYWTRGEMPRMMRQYQSLRDDEPLVSGMYELGSDYRLGPVHDHKRTSARIAEFERSVLASPPPIYSQNGRTRVPLLLGDRLPVTFTWRESSEPVLLTANVAAAAGYDVPKDSPRANVRIGPDRQLVAQRVTIPYLRVGSHMVRDVEAFVLPPEGEDLGCHISAGSLRGVNARADLARLQLIETDGD